MRLYLSSVLSQSEAPSLHCQRLQLLCETFTEIWRSARRSFTLSMVSTQRRDEALHVASQPQYMMHRAFFLDIVIRQRSCILRLLPVSVLTKICMSSHRRHTRYSVPFLLDVVIRQCSCILNLRSCEDRTLLFWRNTFLFLDLASAASSLD